MSIETTATSLRRSELK